MDVEQAFLAFADGVKSGDTQLRVRRLSAKIRSCDCRRLCQVATGSDICPLWYSVRIHGYIRCSFDSLHLFVLRDSALRHKRSSYPSTTTTTAVTTTIAPLAADFGEETSQFASKMAATEEATSPLRGAQQAYVEQKVRYVTLTARTQQLSLPRNLPSKSTRRPQRYKTTFV